VIWQMLMGFLKAPIWHITCCFQYMLVVFSIVFLVIFFRHFCQHFFRHFCRGFFVSSFFFVDIFFCLFFSSFFFVVSSRHFFPSFFVDIFSSFFVNIFCFIFFSSFFFDVFFVAFPPSFFSPFFISYVLLQISYFLLRPNVDQMLLFFVFLSVGLCFRNLIGVQGSLRRPQTPAVRFVIEPFWSFFFLNFFELFLVLSLGHTPLPASPAQPAV